MDDIRGPRGEYDWWTSFTAGHPDLEDGALAAMADAERAGTLPPGPLPAVPEEVTELDDREEAHVNPADVTEGMTEEEVQAEIQRQTRVNARAIAFDSTSRVTVLAFGVTPQLRDLFLEAWEHYMDHGCVGGAQALDLLLEQLVTAMHDARVQTDGRD